MDKREKVKCPNEQRSGYAGVGTQTNCEWSFGRHSVLWEYCHQHCLVDEDRKPEESSEGCFVDTCEESVYGNKNEESQGQATVNSECKGCNKQPELPKKTDPSQQRKDLYFVL